MLIKVYCGGPLEAISLLQEELENGAFKGKDDLDIDLDIDLDLNLEGGTIYFPWGEVEL